MGSSPNGSNLAAGLGISYTFAGFINPAAAAPALRNYRENFQSRGHGLDTPLAILAVNVAVGDTNAEGLHLANSPEGFYARLGRAGRDAGSVTVPTAYEGAQEMTQVQKDEPVTITDGQWPRFVAGGPNEVRATLKQMIEESGADELMIQDLIADPAASRHTRTSGEDIRTLTAAVVSR